MHPVEERLRQKLRDEDWTFVRALLDGPVTKIRDAIEQRAAGEEPQP